MAGVISDLKAQARTLHRQIDQGESQAVARTRQLPEFKDHDLALLLTSIKRRHCLAIVARELGFRGMATRRRHSGRHGLDDFGTLLYPDGADAHWNIWSASYLEARAIREPRRVPSWRIAATSSSSIGISSKRLA
jgi:hypothetical protein